MVKKTQTITEETQPVEEYEVAETVIPIVEKVPSPTDMVQVTVVIGTLQFEGGRFERGETFTVTRERAAQFEVPTVSIAELS